MWFSSSRLGPGLNCPNSSAKFLHEVTTSSKFAMEDAFCRSKGYYRNALADENRRLRSKPFASSFLAAVRGRESVEQRERWAVRILNCTATAKSRISLRWALLT